VIYTRGKTQILIFVVGVTVEFIILRVRHDSVACGNLQLIDLLCNSNLLSGRFAPKKLTAGRSILLQRRLNRVEKTLQGLFVFTLTDQFDPVGALVVTAGLGAIVLRLLRSANDDMEPILRNDYPWL
jgi:hypothetical protein